jgi:hypothetical protein
MVNQSSRHRPSHSTPQLRRKRLSENHQQQDRPEMKPATLTELAAALAAAKAAENAAKNERLLIEEQILTHMDKKDEGTVSDKEAGITVTYKITRTVDTEALQAAWASLPEHAHKAFKWKADVDIRNLRSLKEFDEASYAVVTQFVTAKPAKPTVSVKGGDE